jgi:hypothetical protein
MSAMDAAMERIAAALRLDADAVAGLDCSFWTAAVQPGAETPEGRSAAGPPPEEAP